MVEGFRDGSYWGIQELCVDRGRMLFNHLPRRQSRRWRPTDPGPRAAVFGVTVPIRRYLRGLRRSRLHNVATRLLTSLWFLFLAAATAKAAWIGMISHGSVGLPHVGWPVMVSRICLAIF